MAKSSVLIKRVALVVFMSMFIMSFSPGGHAQIPCTTVYVDLFPCLGFIMNGGTIDPACCSGTKALVGLAKTKPDRQSVCSCLVTFLSKATDAQIKNAARIPGLCAVSLPINITRNIDCSKINSVY